MHMVYQWSLCKAVSSLVIVAIERERVEANVNVQLKEEVRTQQRRGSVDYIKYSFLLLF